MREDLRAGFARRDITQPLGTPSGLSLTLAVDEVWDPLTATAVVIEGEGGRAGRVAVVGLDLMGLLEASHRSIREAVTAATGIPPELVVLNVSHTHSAPYLSADLQAILRPHGLRVMDDAYAALVCSGSSRRPSRRGTGPCPSASDRAAVSSIGSPATVAREVPTVAWSTVTAGRRRNSAICPRG